MKLLLTFSVVAAQPLAGTTAYTTSGMPLYGAPVYSAQPLYTSGMPLYGTPVYSAPVGQPTGYQTVMAPIVARPGGYYGPVVRAPTPAPAPAPAGPSNFDVYLANQGARIENYAVTGNNVLWNVPWSQLFPGTSLASGAFDYLTGYAQVNKGNWGAGQEDLVDQQIAQFRRQHPGPLTQAQRNQLQDLRLTKEGYHNYKLRRAAALLPITLPGGSGLNNYFERNWHEDQLQVAQNQLDDARRTEEQTPSPQNAEAVRHAHQNIRQDQDWKEANTFDLLGTNFGHAGRLGPIFRTKASTKAKQTALENKRDAENAYRQNPTAENRLKLQIAMETTRAWQQDTNANKDEIAYATVGTSPLEKLLGVVGNAKHFQDEESHWKHIADLNKRLVHLERADALRNATATNGPVNTVQQRMLALSDYGPAQARPGPPTHPY